MSMTRREFMATGSAATAAFMSTVPLVHAGGQEATIKIGLVGCGGRGSGAAENCLSSAPNVQLTAYFGCQAVAGGCVYSPDPTFWSVLANTARGGE